MSIEIRTARVVDLPRLTEIYNYYVIHTPITFDLDPFSVEERKKWLSKYDANGPYRLLVAVDQEKVIGYASSGMFRNKRAYDTSIETTVYLANGWAGKGIGTLLYSELFRAICNEDLHRAYAGVTHPNDASIALHQKFKFESVGICREVGRKLGRYWDVEWFEKKLPHDAG